MKKVILTTLFLFFVANVNASEKIDHIKNPWIDNNNYDFVKNSKTYKKIIVENADVLLKMRNSKMENNAIDGCLLNAYYCFPYINFAVRQLGGDLIYPEASETFNSLNEITKLTSRKLSVEYNKKEVNKEYFISVWEDYFRLSVDLNIMMSIILDYKFIPEKEGHEKYSKLSYQAANIFLEKGEQAKQDFIKKTITERSDFIKEGNMK